MMKKSQMIFGKIKKTRRHRFFAVILSAWFAGVLFSGCESVMQDDTAVPTVVNSQKARLDARAVLLQATANPSPEVRAHAMEAIGNTLGASEGSYLEQGLRDESSMVQFAAAMSIGDIRYTPARNILANIVEYPESDKRVVCASIYALYRIGVPKYAPLLAKSLTSDKEQIRSCGAMVLGKMGDTSAIEPLKNLLREETSTATRFNIIQAMAELGDIRSMKMLASFLQEYFLDMKLAAVPAITECHVPNADLILRAQLRETNPPRVRVSAAGALGKMGQSDPKMYEYCVECIRNPQEILRNHYGEKYPMKQVDVDSLVRLSVMAIGDMRDRRGLPMLNQMLKNPDGSLRVTAAMSILHILEPAKSSENTADETATPDTATPEDRKLPPYLPKLFSSDGLDDFPDE
ncbi:MAG TPA: HEAT repeat domain-containing protein [Phycisphaerae bacterium]|nr:HEAT repeat domain-containing protein [Phycisphaerae bacterium]HPS52876.1 HEAT repeat domain-containing protein [Phycisphaerae bacterium]